MPSPKIETVDIDTLPAGREMDALVAELLGVDIPTPELAKARVGMSYVISTGPIFSLKDGRSLLVPKGESLPDVPGTDDWNARYGVVVADFLGDEIRDEIAAYRLPPKPYSTSIAAAMGGPVCEMQRQGFWLKLTSPFFPGDDWHAGFAPHNTTGWNGRPDFRGKGKEGDGAEAICQAALKAKEHTRCPPPKRSHCAPRPTP